MQVCKEYMRYVDDLFRFRVRFRFRFRVRFRRFPLSPLALNRKRIEETVKKNVEKAQRKQKEYYDEKHGASSCYTIGSLVYKKHFHRKKRCGGKLDNKWEGPFVIAASLGKGLFKLHEVNGTKASYYNYMFVSI